MGQKHPTQQVVPLGAAGREFDQLFERCASLDQIPTLNRRRSLSVERLGTADAGLLGASGNCGYGQANEKREK